MMKFRKLPVVVDAVQWNGSNLDELLAWGAPVTPLTMTPDALVIDTLEDGPDSQVRHVASLGDWIIRGVHGEFYPCKPDIFALTYEGVD